ncbi:uncharacterized protein [Physcomitrium patens]|uniref:F-box domain-containing protein n=1 Tax=Physcomitrium patens TaxID=3218 RepID=A0A2K1IFC5_PHYPA|nr:F-box protein At4g35930-like isoform X2 [Physcomitrium patens]PNR27978.1 hypothetical protein PHYPA_028570 [Physcomitrium patens]|eukprot:XP_024363372.1 F-box protein At4g35930-like isoform X2 [Physcomitrella patens]
MALPRRRDDSCRGGCGQPDAVTFVKRQRRDSPHSCVGITIGLEDRAGPSCAASSYRRVPELTRGSSQTFSSGRALRSDIVMVSGIKVSSISEQRIQGLEHSMDTQTQVPRRRKYLRPGQLAKLVDEHKKSRMTNALRKKNKIGNSIFRKNSSALEVANVTDSTAPSLSSPVPTLQVFGPAYPQRKKLVAPRTPLTPASQLTVVRDPMHEVDFPSQSESPLEGLPVELLVHIVCRLHHDQLKPVFHVCRSLQEAVNIAREMHFNFTTPDFERQKTISLCTPKRYRDFYLSFSEAPGGVLDVRPPTPQAPRHGPKPPHVRIPLSEMKTVVAPLFQGPRDTPHRPPGLPRPTFKAIASHRVLFNEAEFCQGGAL